MCIEPEKKRTRQQVFALPSVGCIFVVLVFLASLTWLFWPAFFAKECLVYRDGGHFYFPLYRFVNSQWSSGNVPLWNPFDNLGQPLLANATAAVLYPGKLVFALPLDYAVNYGIYVVGHVVLAGAALYFCARHWGVSRSGAALGAVSYALSGSVLFQYCNIIYLVGAAWMPLALLAAERMLRSAKKTQWAVILGIVLTLMIFGGEPQSAYHALLSAVVLMILLYRRQRFGGWKRCVLPVACLLFTVVTTFILAAVQVVPSCQWARNSDRNALGLPRNVYEGMAAVWRHRGSGKEKMSEAVCETVVGMVGEAPQGTHQAATDKFSIGPWRFVELIIPNAGGRQFPIHRRWINGLPGEGSVWTPSLYLGLVPLVAAWATWSMRRGCVVIRWLWALSLLASAGSLGRYGVGWLIHEVCYVFSGELSQTFEIGDSVGGIYWLMKSLLPGYIYFRFPAKLFTLATLALCLLAGRGWDAADASPQELCRWFFRLGILVFSILLGVLAIGPWWRTLMQNQVNADLLFGPYDLWGGYFDLTTGLVQSLSIGTVSWLLLRWLATVRARNLSIEAFSVRRTFVQSAILLMTAVELLVAHGWTIQFAPRHLWYEHSSLANEIRPRDDENMNRTRLFRAIWSTSYPFSWSQQSSVNRHVEGLVWDRDTIYPNFHLPHRIPVVGIRGTMVSRDYDVLMAKSYEQSKTNLPPPNLLDALVVRHVVAANTIQPALMERVEGQSTAHGAVGAEVSLWRRKTADSRVWFVPWRNVATMQEPAPMNRREWNQCAKKTLLDHGIPRDLRTTAVVCSTVTKSPKLWRVRVACEAGQVTSDESYVQIVRDQPQLVEIDADLANAGLVVLADQFYPGWELSVATPGEATSVPLPIFRTNMVMRGAVLPAGKHKLIYRYRPAGYYWGAAVSAFGWVLLGTTIIWKVVCRRLSDLIICFRL